MIANAIGAGIKQTITNLQISLLDEVDHFPVATDIVTV